MKKLISLILILSILISLLTSCENEEAPTTTSSVESSSSSESSSTGDKVVSSSDELTNEDEIQDKYPVQYPELIEENYYTTIKHGAHDFGATPKSGNGFEYCIFWDYEDYESSLASNTLPIAHKELFDDNIVIFISNPSYLEEYYDYYITGFKEFKYDYNSMSITATNLAKISNPKYDVLEHINEIPYIPPTFVLIPKTIENGLAHFARNYDVSLKIKTESLPYNNYEVRTKVVNQAPSYDGDKLWLILNEADYGDFVVETDIDLMKGYNGFNGKISIIHYSPYGALNSISHRYSNVHMHADGTIYMEYSRLFLEERKAPESYTPTYTLINIYADDIDFDPAKANGRLICESYDYYANLKELHQTSVYPVENKYYNQIKLGDISRYNPPVDYLDYYEEFYLLKTIQELRDFGLDTYYYDIAWNDYYYLVSTRAYYNRGYADVGFANFRIENGVPKIDLYEAPIAKMEEDTLELSVILIPRGEIPDSVLAENIEINHITEEYLPVIENASQAGESGFAELGANKIYTDYHDYVTYNRVASQVLEGEEILFGDRYYQEEINEAFFDENIVIVIERRQIHWGTHILGYRDIKVVNGKIQIIVDMVYNDSRDKLAVYEQKMLWDDHIVIPKSLLEGFEVTSETKLHLIVSSQYGYDSGMDKMEDLESKTEVNE